MSLQKKFYLCPTCDFVTTSPEKLTFHREKNCGKIKCPFCDKICQGHNYFFFHLNRVHFDGKETVMCPFCNLNCKKKFNFERHIINKHANLEKLYKCEMCNKAFHRKDNCQVHQRHCKKPKLIKVHCGKCQKEFYQVTDFERHKKICASQYNIKSQYVPKYTKNVVQIGHKRKSNNLTSSEPSGSKKIKVVSSVINQETSCQVPSNLDFRYRNDRDTTCRKCQQKFASREKFYRHWMKVSKK